MSVIKYQIKNKQTSFFLLCIQLCHYSSHRWKRLHQIAKNIKANLISPCFFLTQEMFFHKKNGWQPIIQKHRKKEKWGIIEQRNLRKSEEEEKNRGMHWQSSQPHGWLTAIFVHQRNMKWTPPCKERQGEPPLFLFCYSFAMATGSFRVCWHAISTTLKTVFGGAQLVSNVYQVFFVQNSFFARACLIFRLLYKYQ